MDKFIEGVRRFRRTTFPDRRATFEALSRGQSPDVLFITCSDSRVAPHLLTGADPGDLFVVRNAGNLVPPYSGDGTSEEAAIEFAVDVLGVKHIVVCGHSDCGAMRGVLDPAAVAPVPSVARWLEREAPLRESVDERVGPDAPAAERLRVAIELNVCRQLERLVEHPSAAKALGAGRVTVHGWVYDIANGAVLALDEAHGSFIEL